MIPFMKPSLPNRRKLDRYLSGIYERGQLTNNGPLVQELTVRLEEYLGVKNLLLVCSGTMALQIAYRALEINAASADARPEAVTTPFTFVATGSSLQWEGIRPVFADIRPDSLNLCPKLAEAQLRENTEAIVPVHVYGNPCDVESFADLSARAQIKLVYDAAHSFGIRIDGNSVLNWGDAAVLSFHATKVFNTVEGGAVVFNDRDAYERACELINFGADLETLKINRVGINAKMTEVHAAFGLALLDEMDSIIERRMELFSIYSNTLPQSLQQPTWRESATRNAAYMPVLFESNSDRKKCERALVDSKISTRRYFSPCLGQDSDVTSQDVSTSAAERVLCLPLYAQMRAEQAKEVAAIVSETIK